MKKLNHKMSLQDFAIFVAEMLKQKNIDVILTGGAVVSIYSEGKYVSKDADFLSVSDHQIIKTVMLEAGFKSEGKDFYHWKDRQSLEQAVMVAAKHPVKLLKIEKWSIAEGMKDRYDIFARQLKGS